MALQPTGDDSFELYDLRVEVICPPGERILCGAKEGDHFILEGEMLRLPEGQGFSIYSLGNTSHPIDRSAQTDTFPWGSCRSSFASCKTTCHVTKRLDVYGF